MRHEVYYQQRIIPCECGSTEPYWHGPEDGRREYCCDACWREMQRAVDDDLCSACEGEVT